VQDDEQAEPGQALPNMTDTSITLREPAKAAFLAWLVPGLGHFYQGRVGKGWLYATCILGLYAVGFYLGSGKNVYWRWVSPFNTEKFMLHYVGQFFVGLPALPALIQATIEHFRPGANFLGGFMADPPANVLNALLLGGKPYEIGLIYTTVAGLLNVLAIYDAYEGPAYGRGDEPDARADANVEAAPTAASAGGPSR
jgi:TM2 domain-containing membrane protein YozV